MEIRQHLHEMLQQLRGRPRERWGPKQALVSMLHLPPNRIHLEEEGRDPVRDSHLSSEPGRISEVRHGATKVVKGRRIAKKRE